MTHPDQLQANDECPICEGIRWVCENHHDKPWAGFMPEGFVECCGGAGMPCLSCNPCGGRDDPPDNPPDFKVKATI